MQGHAMNFDEFLNVVGGFGKYQRKFYFLLSCISILGGFTNMDFVLITAIPKHWCKAPDAFANITLDLRKELTLPREPDGEFSKCKMYNLSGWNTSMVQEYSPMNTSSRVLNLTRTLPQVECSSWEYDRSQYLNTIVSQWDLVCGREALAASSTASYGFGKLIGALMFGGLADRFGRRPVFLICTALNCAIGVAGAFSPEPYSFCVACALKGFVNMGSYTPAFIMILEMVGASWRVAVATIINWYWVVGYMIVAIVSYVTRDWFIMETSLHASAFILVIIFTWRIPESPRWLLRKGRVKEAKKIMKEIAKDNGVEWNETMEEIKEEEIKVESVTLSKLTKSDTMVVITVLSCYMWFSANLMFYGLSFNTANLVGDVYLTFFVSGAVEVPAYGCKWFILQRVGRRKGILFAFGMSSVALLMTLPIPSDYAILMTVFAMIGKFFITIAYGMVYIYTPEMYPTEYRTTGLGLSSTCARVGLILAPYMALLGSVTSKEVPLAIFGIAAGLAGLAGLCLPETRNVPLPETIEDVAKFQQTMGLACCRRQYKVRRQDEKPEFGAAEMTTLREREPEG